MANRLISRDLYKNGCHFYKKNNQWYFRRKPHYIFYANISWIQLSAVIIRCNIYMILHTAMRWQQQNINQIMNSQKMLHSSGVSVMRIFEKTDHIIMAPHCMLRISLISNEHCFITLITWVNDDRELELLINRLSPSEVNVLCNLPWTNKNVMSLVMLCWCWG